MTNTAKPDTATAEEAIASLRLLARTAEDVEALLTIARRELTPQILRIVRDLADYGVDGMRRARGVIQQVHGS